ncbi:MAG: murein biosynthesis integral membrane protein MurJ [Pseudomonadota bacterium]
MSLLKSLATVSGMTVVSRVLGFFRQVLFAGVLGASEGPVADAFWAAFRLPNMFRRLFAEGAFHAAFVPLFSGALRGEEGEAKRFAEDVLATLMTILLALTAVAEIAAPVFVYGLASGFSDDPERFDLAVAFTRIMFPYLICMSMVGLMSGVLNSLNHFFVPATVPILLNLFWIIAAVFFADAGPTTGHVAAWGAMLAGVAQAVTLYLACAKAGFVFRPRAPKLTPEVKRLIKLGVPGFIAAGATSMNLVIGTNVASQQDGAVSWLFYADQYYQLPLSAVGIAMGVVLLPELSRRVKAADEAGAAKALNRAIEASLFLSLPAAAAFIAAPVALMDAFNRELPALLLGDSAYTVEDGVQTGRALAAFACGLPAFVLIKVFSPAFFAREDTRTPMRYALASIAINAVGSVALYAVFGFLGVAIATSLAAWFNAGSLALKLQRLGLFAPDARLTRRVPRMSFAALAMAGAIGALAENAGIFAGLFFGQIWLTLLALLAATGLLYVALCLAIGGASLRDLDRLKRRAA